MKIKLIYKRKKNEERGYSESREIFKRFTRTFIGKFLLFYIAVILFVVVFADVLSPHDPLELDLTNKFLPPVGMSWNISTMAGGEFVDIPVSGSWEHILGTDSLGRDILSRLISSARTSILVGLGAVAIAASFGISLGTIAGYFRGKVDYTVMRPLDVLWCFPATFLAIVIMAAVGASMLNLIIIIGIVWITPFTRLVRGSVLSEREKEYVMAAKSIGVRNLKIMVRHILPNVIAPILVIATLEIAAAILIESSLSYLGVGVPTEIPTWGNMLASARPYMRMFPTLVLLPGIAIMLSVLGFNLAGDRLRDAMDPTLRN